MNKKLQHSPGPWTYDKTSVWDADNCYVCSWVTLGNASLIAAAPDMLRLLRVVCDPYNTWPEMSAAINEGRGIIRKLDGQQP